MNCSSFPGCVDRYHRILFLSALFLIVKIYSTAGQGFTESRKRKTIQQYKKLVRKEQRTKGDVRAHSAGSNRGEHPTGDEDAKRTRQDADKRKQSNHKDMLVPFFISTFPSFYRPHRQCQRR